MSALAQSTLSPIRQPQVQAAFPVWAQGLFRPKRYKVAYGGRGSTKCLALGTRVIMADGALRPIEEVRMGEQLMGPDSLPRNVLSTTRGFGKLYKVHQTSAMDYVVNENHTLSLRKSASSGQPRGMNPSTGRYRWPNGRYPSWPDITNIGIQGWMSQSKRWRAHFRGWRIPCRVARKKIKKEDVHKNKDFLLSEVNVTPYGTGEFAGVALDGDQLFLLEDGTVTHNSWSIARALLILSVQRPLRILCARELQNSIEESVHRLLSNQIHLLGFDKFFDIQKQGIYRFPYPTESGPKRGSEFIFYGIKSNTNKVKSAEGLDIAWVEEAEKVSEDSWNILIPTLREQGSEIWVSFNPDEETDPTYQRFVVNADDIGPDRLFLAQVNWTENPWFPEDLRQEKDFLYRVDPESAANVWGGLCRQNMSSQIFRGKYSIADFTPPPSDAPADQQWDGPYYGADWGFAQDPTVLMKMWIDGRKNRLMIEKEAWKIGLELDDTATFFYRAMPEVVGRMIRADSSRPETISYVGRTSGENIKKQTGDDAHLMIEEAEKWPGSVEDGVAFLKKFDEIVIHQTNCPHQAMEARHYSYKRDRLTRDVLPEIVDKNNHCWDADRYALTPMIQGAGTLGVWARLGR